MKNPGAAENQEVIQPEDESAVLDRRYRRAGWLYLVLGVCILAITVVTPELASAERRSDLIHLIVGLPFFALFAAFIAFGDRWIGACARLFRARAETASRIGRQVREKVVMLLAVSALGRTLVFVLNGLGYQPRVRFSPFLVELIAREPAPRMLINAVLMAMILGALVRASWLPFLARFRGR